jgi:hypothetical protein
LTFVVPQSLAVSSIAPLPVLHSLYLYLPSAKLFTFYPEDGGNKFLRNTGTYLPYYIVSYP